MSASNKDVKKRATYQGNLSELRVDQIEASGAKPKRAPSPRRCREFIRRQAANAMPEIVKAFVEKAKGGSVPHFTSLAKVGGFDQRPAAADTPKPVRRSLARQLLDEVERYEAQQAADQASANAEDAEAEERTDKRAGK